ncbi:hypothetical protein chiPu_0014839 [Chiloscyllium punctatum]|uniref:Uncharacterized protein n=1 Tax=Chiloscyllium punctatum TaxID=137246 RepID=A0A401T140_CHIPU|nr:hypothetical protein [Chiloscyllium punctatum]
MAARLVGGRWPLIDSPGPQAPPPGAALLLVFLKVKRKPGGYGDPVRVRASLQRHKSLRRLEGKHHERFQAAGKQQGALNISLLKTVKGYEIQISCDLAGRFPPIQLLGAGLSGVSSSG